jgi:membrane protease YdiL (CAAX protease family)
MGVISFISGSALILTGFFFWLWRINQTLPSWSKSIVGLGFYALVLGLFYHQIPGFNNLKVLEAHKFSSNSAPFTLYFNYDKAFIGAICFYLLGFDNGFKNLLFWKQTIIITIASIILLLGPAIALNYVQFEFKYGLAILVWALNNLLFVCLSEELIFRRLIQKDLITLFSKKAVPWANTIGIFIAAILFGLAHFKGGVTYITLSSLAGLFYGYAYYKTKNIEGSILVHFGLNLFHILFLTYPYTLKV